MKSIVDLINEKLIINKNTKISKKRDYIEPEDIEDMENPGKDYFGDDVVLIGKPFQNVRSGQTKQNFLDALHYIRKNGYTIYNDLADIDNLNEYPKDTYFIYACHKGDKELNCYVYGPEGVYGVDE
jgi:hypothetical protein